MTSKSRVKGGATLIIALRIIIYTTRRNMDLEAKILMVTNDTHSLTSGFGLLQSYLNKVLTKKRNLKSPVYKNQKLVTLTIIYTYSGLFYSNSDIVVIYGQLRATEKISKSAEFRRGPSLKKKKDSGKKTKKSY